MSSNYYTAEYFTPDDYPEELYQEDTVSPMEADILKIIGTYLTIVNNLLTTGHKDKKELKKEIKKAKKIRKAVMKQDGSIKKYLREDSEYYDWL